MELFLHSHLSLSSKGGTGVSRFKCSFFLSHLACPRSLISYICLHFFLFILNFVCVCVWVYAHVYQVFVSCSMMLEPKPASFARAIKCFNLEPSVCVVVAGGRTPGMEVRG